MELPYRLYRLTRADGSAPFERPEKHPFCMSRVYYEPGDKPEEARRLIRLACPLITRNMHHCTCAPNIQEEQDNMDTGNCKSNTAVHPDQAA
jgi:hypothetical protein